MLRSDGLRRATALAAALLVGLVVALVVWAAMPAEAAFSGSTGAIAFQKGNHIYRMNADGFAQDELTSAMGGAAQFPSWSADGERIVFSHTVNFQNYDIYLMNRDGTGPSGPDPANLTNSSNLQEVWPTWDKLGTKVFFQGGSTISAQQDIYMLNLAQPGSQPVKITDTADSNESQPAVSPDGTKIAFVSNRDGDYDIYVMKAARESARNVAQKLTRTNNAQNPILAREFHPDWSPNGTQLAFTRVGTELPLNWEIFKMKAAPEGRLNRAVNLTKSANTLDEDPAWSPDGKKIAFVVSPTNGGDQDIYRMRATDGANRVNLTEDSTNNDTTPSWQPLP